MSKVLFIACRLPYPLDDGWKIRTFNLLKGLVVKGHSVDLVTFVSDCENEIPNALRQLCRDIYSVDRKRGYAVIDLLKGLIAKKPFSVFNYGNKEMKELIESLINLNYDFIQIEDIVMAEYLPLKSEAFKILDMHNIESKLLIRYAEQEKNALKKIYAYMTAYKLHNYEIQTSRLFDNIYVCSESDRQHLLKYIEKNKISVIPNGVDCTYYQSNDRIRTENRLVFVGSMDYHANMSGISYFVKEIFPRVVASFPKVVLYIVGKNPPVHITRLAGPRIVVTGAVEDVRPFLSSAALVIVPLLVGGGTRLKILEAMAMGKPVISTSVGCEGLDVTNDDNIIIANDVASFAEKIVKLLNDHKARHAIGENGRLFVQEQYDWKRIWEKMELILPTHKQRETLPFITHGENNATPEPVIADQAPGNTFL